MACRYRGGTTARDTPTPAQPPLAAGLWRSHARIHARPSADATARQATSSATAPSTPSSSQQACPSTPPSSFQRGRSLTGKESTQPGAVPSGHRVGRAPGVANGQPLARRDCVFLAPPFRPANILSYKRHERCGRGMCILLICRARCYCAGRQTRPGTFARILAGGISCACGE